MSDDQDDPRQQAARRFRTTLAPLLALADSHPTASELTIDGASVGLDIGGSWLRWQLGDFGLGERDIQGAARNAAVFAGIEFGTQEPQRPVMSVKLPPDLRVSVVCPPVGETWHLSTRFLRSGTLTIADYVRRGNMTEGQSHELCDLLARGKNLIISGGTSSGKTTLLRTLLELPAESHKRVVTIEDAAELNLGGGALQWCATATTDMAALLRQAMRMRPDRIVVGEVRGPEALEVCTAANTGHDGVLSTLHSNGGADTLHRLHNLVRRAAPNILMDEISTAVDYDVHLVGHGRDVRLSEIWKVPRG